jgi:hypothetical protein
VQKRTGQDDAGKTRIEEYSTLMRVLDGLKREKDSIVKGEDRQEKVQDRTRIYVVTAL